MLHNSSVYIFLEKILGSLYEFSYVQCTYTASTVIDFLQIFVLDLCDSRHEAEEGSKNVLVDSGRRKEKEANISPPSLFFLPFCFRKRKRRRDLGAKEGCFFFKGKRWIDGWTSINGIHVFPLSIT